MEKLEYVEGSQKNRDSERAALFDKWILKSN